MNKELIQKEQSAKHVARKKDKMKTYFHFSLDRLHNQTNSAMMIIALLFIVTAITKPSALTTTVIITFIIAELISALISQISIVKGS